MWEDRIYLPSIWAWEESTNNNINDSNEEEEEQSNSHQLDTLFQKLRIKQRPMNSYTSGTADEHKPINCIPVSRHQHGLMWRQIMFLRETWDILPEMNTQNHILSMSRFIFLNQIQQHTETRRCFTTLKSCVHGIVHGQSTCHEGMPVSTYDVGSWKSNLCACMHRNCFDIEADFVYVDNGRSLCALTRSISASNTTLRYPERKYLPSYVTNRTSSPLRVSYHRHDSKVVLDQILIDETMMNLRISIAIPTDISNVLFTTVNNKLFYTTALSDEVYCNANVFHTSSENKFANLIEIVEFLVIQNTKRRHFRPWPVCVSLGQDVYISPFYWCNDNIFIPVSLWPSTCHRFHGYHVETSTDVFLPFENFGNSTIFPNLVESGITWSSDDVYKFLLERNSWCYKNGAPIVNVEVAFNLIDWTWCKMYQCECPKLYEYPLYHKKNTFIDDRHVIALAATTHNVGIEESILSRTRLLAERISHLMKKPSQLWWEMTMWDDRDIIRIFGSLDNAKIMYEDLKTHCEQLNGFTVILDRDDNEHYLSVLPNNNDGDQDLTKDHLIIRFATPILMSKVAKKIRYEVNARKHQRSALNSSTTSSSS